MKLNYFIYARKSSETDDRQVQSIDDQLNFLRDIARKNSLNVVGEFTEAKSAKAPKRKEFDRMINEIQKGNADAILCWKLDRLSRNPQDSGTISWLLQKGDIQQIFTSDQIYRPEDNVLMMALEQGMANQFIRDLSKNTLRGLRSKCEQGWMPSAAPLGYLNNPNKRKGERDIIPDPDRFDLMRKMFELLLSGRHNVQNILQIVNEEYHLQTRQGNKISRSTIYRIFKDPFYYGRFEAPRGSGQWFDGKHKPMISYSEFQRIQKILSRKNTNSKTLKDFTYRGLIRCKECGAVITAEEKRKIQKNGNRHNYTYYHCTGKKDPDCSQKKSLEEKKLENQISDLLNDLYVPKEFVDWAYEKLGEIEKKMKRFNGNL